MKILPPTISYNHISVFRPSENQNQELPIISYRLNNHSYKKRMVAAAVLLTLSTGNSFR